MVSSYQRTSNTIGTMGGPINSDYDDDIDTDDDDDDDNNDDDDDGDDDVFSKNVFFVGLLLLKPNQSDRRCLKASVKLNQGTRKVGLLAPKIILDRSPLWQLSCICHPGNVCRIFGGSSSSSSFLYWC